MEAGAFTAAVHSESGREDWYSWCNTTFNSAQAIMMFPHEFFGNYRVVAEQFQTLEAATEKAQELQAEYNKQFDYMYSVNAYITLESNDIEVVPCDIYSTQCTAANTYHALDYETNAYIEFVTYAEARAFALQKKAAREATLAQQFFVEQQVREVGGTAAAWARVA